MFHRIGRAVVHHPVWTIIAWLIAAVALVVSSPGLSTSSDASEFLPRSYESIKAADLQKKAFPEAFSPAAMILFDRPDGQPLTAEDRSQVAVVLDGLKAKKIDQVQQVIPGPASEDGKYMMGLVQMDEKNQGQAKQGDAAKVLRDDGKALASAAGLQIKVGGSAAQALDQKDASSKAEAIISLGTFLIIFLTLLIIFRSLPIAVLPLVMIGVVAGIANSLIAWANKIFSLKADSSVTGLLIVVLFGVGTDYFLFLMFRYRERLRAGDEPKDAMVNAVGRVGEAIASAAGAVIIAFMALILSSLGMLRSMGPALAIAVAVTLVAGLTLFPAVVSLVGTKVFWPSKSWQHEPSDAKFAAMGRLISTKPALVAVVSGGLMVVLALGALGYKANFDLASSSMPANKESMVVQKTITTAYSAGASDPSHVYLQSSTGPLDEAALEGYSAKLAAVPGVSSVGKPTFSPDRATADFAVLLKYDPASGKALNAMGDIRDTAHKTAPPGTKALVGGMTSVFKDIDTAVKRDYSIVFPVAAVLIMLILGLLLRSAVAPLYLMASVGLGFGATLGASVFLFQNIQGEPGLMFMLPVIMYLFVVAIGTDYNILMIARLREEAQEGLEPREAAAVAVRHAGPTIAAAGFILAATFATLMLAGNSMMTAMGFAVAFGIVVSAFVMALFFTPALTALIGHKAWWPGHGDRKKETVS